MYSVAVPCSLFDVIPRTVYCLGCSATLSSNKFLFLDIHGFLAL